MDYQVLKDLKVCEKVVKEIFLVLKNFKKLKARLDQKENLVFKARKVDKVVKEPQV